MTVQCGFCGKFISNKDMDTNVATYCFVPDTDRTSEYSYWVCQHCKESYETQN